MAPATPATKPKRDARKTCTVCRVKFMPCHRSVMTCSEGCKRVRRNKSAKSVSQKCRKAKPLPISNAFIQLLLRHAKQAGTVQIFQFITAPQLLELREMHKVQQAANAWSRDSFGLYQFCHVYPVKGQPFVGKFTPANLVIGRAELNYEHGSQWLGGGEFIQRSDKSVRWDIANWMTDLDIMNLLIECIGQSVWAEFTRAAKLAPSKRQSYLETLTKLLDRGNTDHREWLKMLDNPRTSTSDLSALLEVVTGKQLFSFPRRYMTPMEVAIAETQRLSACRPELSPLLKGLEQVEQMSRYVDCDSFDLGADEACIFNMLHGSNVSLAWVEQFVLAALSKIADKVESFDQVVMLRPLDFYTPEQLADYHAVVAAAGSGASSYVPDYTWLDRALVEQAF